MSQNENVTEIPVAPVQEAPSETVTLTFNKKKIARIAGYSTAVAAAVTGAVLYFKKSEDDTVTVEPLDDGFAVYETPAQD
jgi:hypothetical protein